MSAPTDAGDVLPCGCRAEQLAAGDAGDVEITIPDHHADAADDVIVAWLLGLLDEPEPDARSSCSPITPAASST